MKDFADNEEVELRDGGDNYYADALPTMWVKRPKGAEVRRRLVCKGCDQETIDKDDTYASTPLLISLKLRLVVGYTTRLSCVQDCEKYPADRRLSFIPSRTCFGSCAKPCVA